jgi:hypothetical protein
MTALVILGVGSLVTLTGLALLFTVTEAFGWGDGNGRRGRAASEKRHAHGRPGRACRRETVRREDSWAAWMSSSPPRSGSR